MKAELAGRDIAFVLEEVSGNPQIRADEDLLDQALINLIQNAADALTGIDDPRITVRAWLNERGRAIIEVEDNGPGVSTEIADRIFLPFFSTKQEGSGIGLALTRQIVMVHGGALVLMPDRERGACFRLTL